MASHPWPHGLDLVRSRVRNAQGLKLSCYTFPAKNPVAHIIFHHGYSTGGRFEFLRASEPGGPHDSYDNSFIQVMRDHGLTVVVMDMQGMGDSERVRTSVSGHSERLRAPSPTPLSLPLPLPLGLALPPSPTTNQATSSASSTWPRISSR